MQVWTCPIPTVHTWSSTVGVQSWVYSPVQRILALEHCSLCPPTHTKKENKMKLIQALYVDVFSTCPDSWGVGRTSDPSFTMILFLFNKRTEKNWIHVATQEYIKILALVQINSYFVSEYFLFYQKKILSQGYEKLKDISKTIMNPTYLGYHIQHAAIWDHLVFLQIDELPAPLLILDLDDQIGICHPGYVRKRTTDCCHKLAFAFDANDTATWSDSNKHFHRLNLAACQETDTCSKPVFFTCADSVR